MPVEIKEAKEKELQQLKSRATRKEQIETERRMAKKYKLLKFIGQIFSVTVPKGFNFGFRAAESRPQDPPRGARTEEHRRQ